MTSPLSHRLSTSFLGAALVLALSCAPSEVTPPRPMDASTTDSAADSTATDAPRDAIAADADATTDAAPDVTPGGPCGDGGVCGGGQRCDPARMRCVDCLAADHCGGATPVCASGRCVAATPCTSSRTCPGQVCDLNAMRCVDCVTDAECDAGQRCVASVCGAPVTCRSSRDCSAAGLVCNVAQMRCVECLDDRDCAMGSTCTAGNVCRVAACTPNARRCVGMARVAVCDARGAAETEADCASGEVCTGGECRRLLCAPGMVSCESATARRTCNADGMAYTVAACASGEGCVAGECRAPGCMPGAATCTSATERRVCNADGMTFATMACPAGQMCSGGTCAAAPTCPAGQTLCGAACVDLQRDVSHCGGCGRACAAGMTCASGVCNLPVESPAPMLSPRAGHALVTLADSRVLALGGHNGTSATQSAEIYDPVANRWQSVAPMTASFSSLYGVLLPDGRVAVSGNARTGTSNGTVEVFNPTTNAWARLPGAGSGSTSTFAVARVWEGHLHGIALEDVSVRRFDLTSMTWSNLGPRFTAVRFSSGSAMVPDAQGRIHLFGNNTGTLKIPPTAHAIVSLSDGTWTMGPALSAWRFNVAGVLGPDGLLYLSGGQAVPPPHETGADMRSFDPRTNTFRSLAPLPESRSYHRMTLLSGGRILVTGGVRVLAGRTTYLNTTAIYTIATNTWR